MAAQKGVQDYLEKHKISALFEDLMSKLVNTLPSEPVPYLIKILQKFEEKAKKQHPKEPSKPRTPVVVKTKSPSATPTEAKRSRPTVVRTISSGTSEWTVLPMRKPKRAESKQSLDNDTPPNQQQRQPKKSNAKLTANSELWAVEGEESASRMPAESDQPRPTSQQQEETLMKEELSTKTLGRKTSQEEKTDKEEQETAVEQRKARPGQKSKEHKKELAELVASQREVETLTFLDTGEDEGDVIDPVVEEATDIYEDADELMDEGLGNVKSSGQKVKKKKMSKGPDVKVTMCNTCARVIKGDGSSDVRSFGGFTSIESSSGGSGFGAAPGSQRGGGGGGLMSDDDFESASQVSGPRQPVWESEGEDGASVTQRSVHDGTSELFQMGARGRPGMRQQAWMEGADVGNDRQVATPTASESSMPRGHTWHARSDDDDSSV
ncbi:uncharacterized protein [Apostichopus japonicus]|uniref:uncharacterized protein isoform X2 n=1 Tax=Stichopus japonicus TaxID=307972 RepID=UPI003AB323A1